ncbi:MAG: thymidine phosphorylase [Oceanipulchritudo sp.]
MNPQEVIRRKRDGEALDAGDIGEFLDGVVSGSWTRAQAASLLMAIFQRGMEIEETRLLLDGMLHSGEVLDLSGISRPKVDKHSTGGVGDKVSIVLAPLAAACGLVVPMLSGRGLGHTGGTLDKLEAIPGYKVFLSSREIARQADKIGCVIAGQTDRIVPADRILYALRDETATVEHPALIAASILSKKLAEGIGALLLDVKFGRGAFLEKRGDAEALARLMVDLGNAAGCRTAAWLTRMDAPLGRAVGNALEIVECIGMLKGGGPEDLADFICQQVAGLLGLAGLEMDFDSALATARGRLADGSALARFAAMVEAQGGNPSIVDDPSLLPQAKFSTDVLHEDGRTACVIDVDARKIAQVVLETGAGRRTAEDAVDPSTGLSSLVRVGDRLEPGDVLARLHHADAGREEEWIRRIRDAIKTGPGPVVAEPWIHSKTG